MKNLGWKSPWSVTCRTSCTTHQSSIGRFSMKKWKKCDICPVGHLNYDNFLKNKIIFQKKPKWCFLTLWRVCQTCQSVFFIDASPYLLKPLPEGFIKLLYEARPCPRCAVRLPPAGSPAQLKVFLGWQNLWQKNISPKVLMKETASQARQRQKLIMLG